MARAKPIADEDPDAQENTMPDLSRQRRNYRFNRRMLYKMKKLLETNYWASETEVLEASVDLLYEMMIKGEIPESFDITVDKSEEEK
jgi:hypothetical protein